MTTYTSLPAFLSDCADAIRSKTGGTSSIPAANFPSAISGISTDTITTATASPTSSSSISFTGLSGKPKMFFMTIDLNFTVRTTSGRWLVFVAAFGNNVLGGCVYATTQNYTTFGAYHRDTSAYSWSYNNGTLTVTVDSETYGKMDTTDTFTLVYVY